MTTTSFNSGWTVRPKTSIFEQIGQAPSSETRVTVPHDALITQERGEGHSGKTAYFPPTATFEYIKSFPVHKEMRDRAVWLEFQGAYRDAVVYVNDEFAGHRPYGYSIFHIPLHDHLRFGQDNTVRVEVRGHEDSRWYTGVGLLRDVLLHDTDPLHLVPYGVHVTHPDVDEERAVLEVAAAVVNERRHRGTVRVRTEVRDADGVVVTSQESPVTVPSGEEAVARQRLYLPAPRLWSVDDPYLYSVEVQLVDDGVALDSVTVPLGIRTIRLDPQHGLRINGHTVKLRGACVHHDNGALGGASVPEAEERRVRLLKDAGFNAIRAAHTPLSIAALDACDRLGMLVMDESFDVWTVGKSSFDYSLDFPEWWARDIESMVLKDRNHPSVIFYSIGNEIPETGNPGGAVWSRRLADEVRRHDSTRLVTNGVNGFVAALTDVMGMMSQATSAGESGGVNDAMGSAGDMMNQISASELVTAKTEEAFAALDVAGVNYGEARYAVDRELFPHRLVVGTETFPGHIDVLWPLVEANPHVLGDFTWAGWDYLGEVGVGRPRYLGEEDQQFEAPYPWISAWVGDLDMTGWRRAISFYRETVFGLRHEPYVAVHRPATYGRTPSSSGWAWPDAIASWSWDVNAGTPIRVDVYSDAEEVELILNGRKLGRAPVGASKACIAEFDLAYEPGELIAVALVEGAEQSRTTLLTSGEARAIALAPETTSLKVDGVAFVELKLVDEDGRTVTNGDRAVTASISGPGELVGVVSGRPDPEHPFTDATCRTFDGRALVIVRATGIGQIAVSVDAGPMNAETVISAGSANG
ncbi:glycoside hydrolase family 2 protein [Cellulomonas pakistanensis]|uniref:Beta-galactosidase n=1 Tax=Cellulomonas pakistanensis TaxID=992287 RepID=A0A919P6X5_9CELL|nr:glycoside hydrolase family 2 TIM barrel-domain containing protein [Cellulomonas pakistanensis]GIG34723.1 beta-galactosidase [Cellulomonas pakistanensis]